jgi:hypothetical protein
MDQRPSLSRLPIFPLIRPICFSPSFRRDPRFSLPFFPLRLVPVYVPALGTFKEGGCPCNPQQARKCSILPVSTLTSTLPGSFHLQSLSLMPISKYWCCCYNAINCCCYHRHCFQPPVTSVHVQRILFSSISCSGAQVGSSSSGPPFIGLCGRCVHSFCQCNIGAPKRVRKMPIFKHVL